MIVYACIKKNFMTDEMCECEEIEYEYKMLQLHVGK